MTICPKCKLRIRPHSPNQIKVKNVILHKKCPTIVNKSKAQDNKQLLQQIKGGALA